MPPLEAAGGAAPPPARSAGEEPVEAELRLPGERREELEWRERGVAEMEERTGGRRDSEWG